MSEEEAALAEALDTPNDSPEASESTEAADAAESATPATESSTDSSATDWAKRYNDLQPEYTRVSQEAAQLRQFYDNLTNPDTQADVLAALGLELEQEDADQYDPEADEPMTRAEFQAFLQEQQQTAQAEAAEMEQQNEIVESMSSELSEIENKHGELTPDEWDAVVDLAISRPGQDGRPDVQGAYQALGAVFEARQKNYVKSKKAAQVQVGTAGSEKVNLADDDARVNLFANMVEAAQQD